jgi:hypothetical protein
MFTVEPMGILLVAMLGLIAAAALASLAVTLMWVIALTLTPVLAGTADRVRRWRWRDWHPPTDWVPQESPVSPGRRPTRSPACGVSVVASRESGVDVRLLTATVPSPRRGADPTLTAVHATLAPTATLELPPHARSNMLVCVLSGHGTVGAQRRRVRAGDRAVVAPGEPVTVAAGRGGAQPSMEVLVAQVPAPAAARAEPRTGVVSHARPAHARRHLVGAAARALAARTAHGWASRPRRRPAA